MTPPNNPEIERRCLSTLLFDAADVRKAVAAGLTAGDFYLPRNSLIFQGICGCAADGPVDPVAVWRAVNGLAGEAVTLADVLGIGQAEGSSLWCAKLTQDVIALSRQRKTLVLLTEAQAEAAKPAADWLEIWERVHPFIGKMQEIGAVAPPRTTAVMLAEAAEQVKNPLAGACPGPFHSVDLKFGPVRAGDYVVLAARPSLGKTALGLEFAAAAAKVGKHAAIFSLEMRGPSLFIRLARQAARTVEQTHVLAALENLPRGLLHIHEADGGSTLAQIEARIRLLNSTYPLGIVIVDYLGLVELESGGNRYQSREREVATISRTLKNLAAALPCPLLLLHQINRQSEIHDRRPILSDLRESGAIEQDADVVWFLHEDKSATPAGVGGATSVKWIQAKSRNGVRNVFCSMNFDGPIFKFTHEIQNNNERTDIATTPETAY